MSLIYFSNKGTTETDREKLLQSVNSNACYVDIFGLKTIYKKRIVILITSSNRQLIHSYTIRSNIHKMFCQCISLQHVLVPYKMFVKCESERVTFKRVSEQH